MYKIAAMGSRDSICGLAALGLEIFPTTGDVQQAARQLRHLAQNGYAVIYVTEQLAAAIPEEIDRYRNARTPAVILVPGVGGNTGAGLANVSRSVEKAVGVNIFVS
jgi:V/A-type H+-transporting ATPase subunit F